MALLLELGICVKTLTSHLGYLCSDDFDWGSPAKILRDILRWNGPSRPAQGTSLSASLTRETFGIFDHSTRVTRPNFDRANSGDGVQGFPDYTLLHISLPSRKRSSTFLNLKVKSFSTHGMVANFT